MAQLLTVRNRTNAPLGGMWNGRQYVIPLGDSKFTEAQAEAFKRQNPIMGSGDPREFDTGMTGRMAYKLGIVEYNDPCDPVDVDPNAIERWDRSKMTGAKPTEVVAGANGLFSVRDIVSNPFSPDTNFTKA